MHTDNISRVPNPDPNAKGFCNATIQTSSTNEGSRMQVASVMKEFKKQDPLNLLNTPQKYRRKTHQITTSRRELDSQKASIPSSAPVRRNP
jgi:hypothetical protein